jgi:hypothetical protein
MRKIYILLGLLLIGTIDLVTISATYIAKATIEWDEMSYDFGEVPFDKPIRVDFKFSNPGMIPLVISEVKTSCGCTVADYPKRPINSGEKGTISVTFDAKTTGYFSKTVTVYSNSEEGITELYIKGIVVK